MKPVPFALTATAALLATIPVRASPGLQTRTADVTPLVPRSVDEARVVCEGGDRHRALLNGAARAEAFHQRAVACILATDPVVKNGRIVSNLDESQNRAFLAGQTPQSAVTVWVETALQRAHLLQLRRSADGVDVVAVSSPVAVGGHDQDPSGIPYATPWGRSHVTGVFPKSSFPQLPAYMHVGMVTTSQAIKPRQFRGGAQHSEAVTGLHDYYGYTATEAFFRLPDGQRAVSNACIRAPQTFQEWLMEAANVGTQVFVGKTFIMDALGER